jgi:hypothetical protein
MSWEGISHSHDSTFAFLGFTARDPFAARDGAVLATFLQVFEPIAGFREILRCYLC